MIYRSVGVAFVGAVVATVAAQSSAVGAGSSDDADGLIRHGIELRKAHDDEGAAREFQKAYDQVHTPRAAGQLGLAEQALGRWEDAERHVGEALHTPDDAWVVKSRAILDEALGTIQSHLARIVVIGDPEGADLSINGRLVGKLPLAEAVRVSAGEVEVELHASGYVPAQRTLTMVGGQYQRLVLHLAKETETVANGTNASAREETAGAGGAVAPIQISTTPSVEPPSQARTVLKWSAAGAAGLGLAVGVTFTILHAHNVSAFDDNPLNCADDNGTAVIQNSTTQAPGCQGALDAYRRDSTWAIVGYVGAGVFAATWLVLQLTERTADAAPAQHASAIPFCAPSGSGFGIACSGRF
jgi:hypothetical protein